jgi:hypothetical protein
MVAGGQRHAPVALPPGKRPDVHLAEGRSGRLRKVSPPVGFDPWTVLPIESLNICSSNKCEIRGQFCPDIYRISTLLKLFRLYYKYTQIYITRIYIHKYNILYTYIHKYYIIYVSKYVYSSQRNRFSRLQNAQTSSGANRTPYSVDTAVFLSHG